MATGDNWWDCDEISFFLYRQEKAKEKTRVGTTLDTPSLHTLTHTLCWLSASLVICKPDCWGQIFLSSSSDSEFSEKGCRLRIFFPQLNQKLQQTHLAENPSGGTGRHKEGECSSSLQVCFSLFCSLLQRETEKSTKCFSLVSLTVCSRAWWTFCHVVVLIPPMPAGLRERPINKHLKCNYFCCFSCFLFYNIWNLIMN